MNALNNPNTVEQLIQATKATINILEIDVRPDVMDKTPTHRTVQSVTSTINKLTHAMEHTSCKAATMLFDDNDVMDNLGELKSLCDAVYFLNDEVTTKSKELSRMEPSLDEDLEECEYSQLDNEISSLSHESDEKGEQLVECFEMIWRALPVILKVIEGIQVTPAVQLDTEMPEAVEELAITETTPTTTSNLLNTFRAAKGQLNRKGDEIEYIIELMTFENTSDDLTVALESGRHQNPQGLTLVVSYDNRAVATVFNADVTPDKILMLLIGVINQNPIYNTVETGKLIESSEELVTMGAMLLK